MATIVLPADGTTLTLNGRIITDYVAGDVFELSPVNPLTAHVNASNGGVNVNKRTDGDVHNLTLRIQKFSGDDAFFQNAVNQKTPVIFNGSAKTAFVRDGTAGVASRILENGSITTQPTEVTNDQDGNALMEYVIQFRSVTRNL